MNALQDRIQMTITKYTWWLACEAVAIAMLYTIMTVALFPTEGVSMPTIGIRALACVTVILTIPNVAISFYAAYRSKCEELVATQYQLQKIREENVRLMAINESLNNGIHVLHAAAFGAESKHGVPSFHMGK